MILAILITLKTLLFINITNIQYNAFLIFAFTTSVSMLILAAIEFSKPKYKKVLQIIFYTLFSLIIFVDIMYYSYYQELPSVALLGMAKQLTAVSDIVIDMISIKNLLFIIDLPITIYYIIKLQKTKEYSKKIVIGVLSTIASLLLIVTIITMKTDKLLALENQEFYSFHGTDIINNYFKDQSIELVGYPNIEDIMDFKNEPEPEPEELRYNGIGHGKNLIVFQIEALQDFVINLNYNNQEITPNLNRLIQDQSSIYFDDYFQSVGRGNTSDAEFVTQNSLFPSMEDYTYSQYGDNTFYGLPWLLRDNGYNSWVFHGYEKSFWNREKAYVNQGFQRFLSKEDFNYKETIGFGISDEEFFDQTLEYLKELDNIDENPFYAFIISLSSHTPYTIDKKYHVLDILKEHKGNVVANYLQAIHYTDKELGRLIDNLKEEGLYDNTVIAIYGDHQGINNSRPEVFPVMEYILGEPYNFDHILNVPLIIHVPGEEIHETISTIGSQIDFYPTIINIMGYNNEKGLMMGKDLINHKGYSFVAPQTTMRKGSFIDKDVLFNISQDGIFKNSTVTSRKTREKLDVNQYRDIYDKAISTINKGEFILRNDLLKDILAEGVDPEQVEIGTIQIPELLEQEIIESYQKFTIDKLETSYNKGNKVIRIPVGESTDLVALNKWMTDHKDAYLILRSTSGEGILELNLKKAKHLNHRYIAEIAGFKEHYLIHRGGYRNIILNIIDLDYDDQEIVDFLTMQIHYAVIMDETRAETQLPKKLEEIGVKVYILGESDELRLMGHGDRFAVPDMT